MLTDAPISTANKLSRRFLDVGGFGHRVSPSASAFSANRGLDAVSLLLAGSGSVYGAFIPVYLINHAWTQAEVGILLTLSTAASMLCQVPAGLLIDLLGPHRRHALAFAIAGMAVAPLVLATVPQWVPVVLAMLMLAAVTSCLIPAVNAISLAVAGHAGFSERLGRNSRYGSIGAGCGALVMGICINTGLEVGLLLIAVALTFPTLWAIRAIGPDREEMSCHNIAPPGPVNWKGNRGWQALLRDQRLLVFGTCVGLFSVASAGVLQVATIEVDAQLGAQSGLVIAAFLILPQIVVAVGSPSIARAAEFYGRRRLLLLGFATLPLRAGLFALLGNSYALIPVQILEGFGGAVFGVLLSLIASDLTRRTGYYTLCLSMLGLIAGLGTAVSTTLAGLVSDNFGRPAAFWVLAVCGVLALAVVVSTMPETGQPIRRLRAGRKSSEPARPYIEQATSF